MGGRPAREPPALPAYVLAGGASRRMGRDKALLPVAGTPLAARVGQVLLDAGAATVHLVGRQAGLGDLGLPVLVEPSHPGHHPLFGLAAALAHASGELALVAACDLVALEAGPVRQLLLHRGPVVAEDSAGRRALLAVLPTAAAAEALTMAREGGPVQPFLRRFPPRRLPDEVLRNANTEAELGDW